MHCVNFSLNSKKTEPQMSNNRIKTLHVERRVEKNVSVKGIKANQWSREFRTWRACNYLARASITKVHTYR